MTITVREDIRIKELMSVKLLLFLQSAGDMALFPFFTLHMKSLGITVVEIGIQFAVTPIATLIATPLVGIIADKLGSFKIILCFSLLLCALIANFMLLVPKVITFSQCERQKEQINVTCSGNSSVTSTLNLHIPLCLKPDPDEKQVRDVKGTFGNCTLKCPKPYQEPSICFSNDKATLCSAVLHDFPLEVLINSENSLTASRFKQISKAYVTFDSQRHLVRCNTRATNKCSIHCPIVSETNMTLYKPVMEMDEDSHRKTFWMYLFCRLGLIIVIATEITLLKAAILSLVDKYDSEYGFQRVWSLIASIAIPPIVGIMSDIVLKSGKMNVFAPCFYMYTAFKIIMAAVALMTNLDVKPPAPQVFEKVIQLCKNPEALVLLLFVGFIGSTWGFIETFIVWYLDQLKASRTVMGANFAISAASGIPFMLCAGQLERRFGHVPIIIAGIFIYAIRLIGYSYATTPFYVLLFEVFDGINSGLVIVTITTYASVLSSIDLIATMQATWASLHYAVGRALGAAVGGFLMDRLGPRLAYQTYAAACVVAASAYTLLYLCFIRRRVKLRISKEKDTKMPNRPRSESIADSTNVDVMPVYVAKPPLFTEQKKAEKINLSTLHQKKPTGTVAGGLENKLANGGPKANEGSVTRDSKQPLKLDNPGSTKL